MTQTQASITAAAQARPVAIGSPRIAQLVTKGIDPDIAELDLEMVKMKLADPEEGAGWNAEQCEDAEVEYKRYLTLCRKYTAPQHSIVPNKIMDTMWHYHILDTQAYCRDCDNLFGGYVHHYPYFGMCGDDDARNAVDAFEQTKGYYADAFGEQMDRSEVGSFWYNSGENSDCQKPGGPGRCKTNCARRCQKCKKGVQT